jgi:hypothetical protein
MDVINAEQVRVAYASPAQLLCSMLNRLALLKRPELVL